MNARGRCPDHGMQDVVEYLNFGDGLIRLACGALSSDTGYTHDPDPDPDYGTY